MWRALRAVTVCWAVLLVLGPPGAVAVATPGPGAERAGGVRLVAPPAATVTRAVPLRPFGRAVDRRPPKAAAARATLGAAAGTPAFRWPLDGTPRPVRRFDPPPRPWLPGHRGVDLAAASGATVRAAGAGTVLFAGVVAGRPVVTVGHAAGLRTTYEPVRPEVRPGDPVRPGTPLGVLLAGHPGCPGPACLHWGLRRGADYLDPLALLGLGPVRLLPVRDPSGPLTEQTASGALAERTARAACRCGRRGPGSGPGEQRGQPDRQPFVLLGGVVDLRAEP
ncbi:murein DD-endopeptidase MepM/ murein hydrolase activator NlpD [Micromonospora purpureochromogenes]|uniref:Murein DD-endopeptidase MepM/ murein hydrolase activator NlpD n=1 Tax=Micromonospora purpureochromogenes TaxID=47872 RepID=A0ABX2RLS6_9ACTN|nr:murein DD-endopeptidase MepM/ murein hydrolase activator NlpD [Micromonospora purpureochromogenes]